MAIIKVGNGSAPPTKEGRVQHCMALMREIRWKRGVTDKELARGWGVDVMAVRQYSAEAWRRIKAEVTDPDSTASTVCMALEKVVEEASTKGLAGHRSVIEAGKAWAAIAGAGAPTRVELGVLANLSEADLEKRRQEIIVKLQESEVAPAGLPEGEDEDEWAAESAEESEPKAK